MPKMKCRSFKCSWDSRTTERLFWTCIFALLFASIVLFTISSYHVASSLTRVSDSSPSVPTSELQDVFQIYHSVSLKAGGNTGCDDVLLVDHIFGASYGAPFVGKNFENSLIGY